MSSTAGSAAPTTVHALRFQRLSVYALTPQRISAFGIGYELYAAYDTYLKPGERTIVYTDIAFQFPPGCYGLLCHKHATGGIEGVDIQVSVLDPTYYCNVGFVMTNVSSNDVFVPRGRSVGMLIVQQFVFPLLQESPIFPPQF